MIQVINDQWEQAEAWELEHRPLHRNRSDLGGYPPIKAESQPRGTKWAFLFQNGSVPIHRFATELWVLATHSE